jgi:hypothetical protein
VFDKNVREGINDDAWEDVSQKLQMFWLAVPGPDIKKFCVNRGNQMTTQVAGKTISVSFPLNGDPDGEKVQILGRC